MPHIHESIMFVTWAVSCALLIGYAFASANDSVYLCALLFWVTQLTFGTNLTMYNSRLPNLCKDHPAVQKAIDGKGAPVEIVKVFKHEMELMNDYAVLYGYIGGVLLLVLSIVFLMISGGMGITTQSAFCCVMVTMGVWWFVFGIPLYFVVRERENAPLPNTDNCLSYIFFSWERTYESLSNIWLMPHTWRFMIAFFICEFAELRLSLSCLPVGSYRTDCTLFSSLTLYLSCSLFSLPLPPNYIKTLTRTLLLLTSVLSSQGKKLEWIFWVSLSSVFSPRFSAASVSPLAFGFRSL